MRIALCSVFCLSVAVVACAKTGDKVVDSSAGTATPTMTPAPATIALADVAGKWNLVATPSEGTDTAPTKSTLTATADTTGWTMTFPGRSKPVALHVRADGDSIISMSEPYESVRRKGVQVTTTSVFRMQDGKLVGTTVARYNSKGADSVLHLRTEATKAP